MPEDMDANLKPYIIQPSGSNLDGIMKVIQTKIDAIDRITHMGSVRATTGQIASGIALRQNTVWDGKIEYPDTFDIRDWASDIQLLQTAKASGVKSETFTKEIDKQIVSAIIDDDESINTINNEIDSSSTAIGSFSTPSIEGQELAEE